MAYVSQDLKAKLAPAIKSALKKYGIKGTIAVRNHMTLVLNIKSGKIDFIENYLATDAKSPCAKKLSADQIAYVRKNGTLDVNPYWYQDHFSGKAKSFLTEVIRAMKTGNWDNSDIQTDYFDVGWYIDVNIGNWKKPYTVEA